jgi:nucleoside-diphosphate-sugar epimerase
MDGAADDDERTRSLGHAEISLRRNGPWGTPGASGPILLRAPAGPGAGAVLSFPAMTTLVTGAFGCIGSWVVRALVARGERPVVFDVGDDPWRLRMVAGDDVARRVTVVRGDIVDRDQVLAAARDHGVARIVHLAAWQVPLCRQDPSRGAAINVVGTANAFEAARASGGRIARVVYASSAAVFGPPALYPPGPLADDAAPRPATHYGVYKVANEETARIYWEEHRIASSGFRPLTVYGPGRDFGVTADPTLAMKSAVLGKPFRIRWGGATDLIHADDVARALLAAAGASLDGARVYNLHGASASMAEVVRTIGAAWPGAAGLITHVEAPLPFPEALDDARYQRDLGPAPATSLAEGVRRTLDAFARLQAAGRLDARELA